MKFWHKVEEFLYSKKVPATTEQAFAVFLNRKYSKGFPEKIDLEQEWAEFYREATSKV